MKKRMTKTSELAFLMRTDDQCINQDVGDLLGAYLLGALRADQRTLFESHVNECLACWTDVTNWGNIAQVKAPTPSTKAKSSR